MNKEWKNKKMVVMQAGGLLSIRRSRMLRRAEDQNEPAPSDFNSILTVTTHYFGNKVYVNNQLKYVLTEEGYIEKAAGSNTYTAHYYLNDRLGNHRIVMDASGTVKQVNNYYPSGTSMAESPRRTDQGVQPYKFGGKELDRFNTLDHYNFEARAFDPTLMRFTRPDPHAERYYNISPYAYCMNNPVRYTDSDGMNPGDKDDPIELPEVVIVPLKVQEAATANPDPNDNKKKEYKKKKSNVSGKEGVKDIPDWVKGEKPYKGESGKNFATRMMDTKYGSGRWGNSRTNPEFSKIQKWADRGLNKLLKNKCNTKFP